MSLSPVSLFAILHPMRGGALSKWQPNVAGDCASLRFSLCRECQTRLLGAARGSGRALRHGSYRICGTGRELLAFHDDVCDAGLSEVAMDRGAHMACEHFPPGGAAARRRVCALLAGCLLFLAATLRPALAARAATQVPSGSAQAKPSLRQDATFTHITIEQGLSDQRVQAIVQDRTGFMWFGTNNGLNRFDGYNIVAYRHDPTNPHSLSGNLIEDLYEDRSGTLWVGTRSGLNAFDRRTERFTRYRNDPANPHSLSDNTVIAIYADRAGVLWLGTAGGLNR